VGLSYLGLLTASLSATKGVIPDRRNGAYSPTPDTALAKT